MIHLQKYWQLIIIAILLIFCFKKCDNKPNNNLLENSYKSEQSKANKYYFDFQQKEQENNELQQELAEMKLNLKPKIVYLKQAQQATAKKPEEVNNLPDCNDTISKLYYTSKRKDSLANGVISDLNGILIKSDSIISGQDVEKELLLNTLLHKSNAMTDLEKLNENNKSLIRQEKNKKLFWQVSTVTAIGVIGKLILFK